MHKIVFLNIYFITLLGFEYIVSYLQNLNAH